VLCNGEQQGLLRWLKLRGLPLVPVLLVLAATLVNLRRLRKLSAMRLSEKSREEGKVSKKDRANAPDWRCDSKVV
jgi:hypothetical protein